ncbi:LysE family translocator [Vibrio nitrifigilis]|uniref:LysE family translocator n=1 Tax=Vibrio nitrifigilis TaxID=2789781 RepID=A0ABS0GGD1_9VIBR|nr:LysE family translocator [Vibrio nitrifigilis]MBF9001496.1 LysE family translocator [Vibrio nitrifigilis]
MTFTFFSTLLSICLLGAMSPGPSLAVVAKHSLSGGRLYGVTTAWSHSLGILIYAILTISGLSLVLERSPFAFKSITYLGAAYLAYLGVRSLLSKGGIEDKLKSGEKSSILEAIRDGFAISILNPKIALFFIALFSQFIGVSQAVQDKAIISVIPPLLDGLWYTLIAIILSSSNVIERIRAKASLIDKISGIILLSLAVKVIFI